MFAMLVWVAAALAFSSAAHACSRPAIVETDAVRAAQQRLRSANTAIYGVVSSVRVLPPPAEQDTPPIGQSFEARIRVTRVFKGMTGRVVRVRGNTDGASCGIEQLRVHQRLGLLLRPPSGPYDVDVSSPITLRELLRATNDKWRQPT